MTMILCPLCNHLLEKRHLAFIKREYAELARLEEEHEKHCETCEVVNGSWYLGLWNNAKVAEA